MGILRTLNKIRGGYPGSWKEYARGYQKPFEPPPFEQPTDPDDRRSLIPPLGLKEYWYPALPAKDVSWKKPVGLKLLGEELVLFKDKEGEVRALSDYCPHRGAYLSWGNCFWKGYLSCPYHGATFDGDGECVEFITEGPDSKMVGRLKAKKYPTRTLKGIVFVWMGEGEPVPIQEDVPPEFFEDDQTLVLATWRYWRCNWMIALENTNDAHNCFYVHRNAIRHLGSRTGGGRPRTPLGYSNKVVNGKTVIASSRKEVGEYYFKDGKMPYQLYYPRVGGKWPLHRWRLLWVWFFERYERFLRNISEPFETPEEWRGMRLPGMQRVGAQTGPGSLFTRWCIPVEKDLTRVLYLHSSRPRTWFGRLFDRVSFRGWREFLGHYNFSDQDYEAMASCRYQYPEFLSATDSHVVAERRLIVEHGRGLKKPTTVREVTTAERQVVEGHELLGVRREDDYGLLTVPQDGDGQGAQRS